MGKKGKGGAVETTGSFALDASKLRVGDVILSTNPDSLVSASIRAVTGSSYSHAILCVNPPYCVESADFGVVRFRIDRFLIRDPSNIKVLRPSGRSVTSDGLQAAADLGESRVSSEYADRDVFRSLIEFLPAREEGKFFCSQLVAAAFEAGKIDVGLAKKPEKVSPQDLADAAERNPKLFRDVTNSVVRRAKVADLMRYSGHLDGTAEKSVHEAEVEAKQRIYNAVRPVFVRLGLAPPTNFFEMMRRLGEGWGANEPWLATIDAEIAAATHASGLLLVLRSYLPPDHADLTRDVLLHRVCASGLVDKWTLAEWEKFYEERAALTATVVAEWEKDAAIWDLAFRRGGLETLRLTLAVVRDALSMATRVEAVLRTCIEEIRSARAGRRRNVDREAVLFHLAKASPAGDPALEDLLEAHFGESLASVVEMARTEPAKILLQSLELTLRHSEKLYAKLATNSGGPRYLSADSFFDRNDPVALLSCARLALVLLAKPVFEDPVEASFGEPAQTLASTGRVVFDRPQVTRAMEDAFVAGLEARAQTRGLSANGVVFAPLEYASARPDFQELLGLDRGGVAGNPGEARLRFLATHGAWLNAVPFVGPGRAYDSFAEAVALSRPTTYEREDFDLELPVISSVELAVQVRQQDHALAEWREALDALVLGCAAVRDERGLQAVVANFGRRARAALAQRRTPAPVVHARVRVDVQLRPALAAAVPRRGPASAGWLAQRVAGNALVIETAAPFIFLDV